MEVLRSERVNDGKAELRLHFSMPDGSMVSVTHRVKIETEVDPPESQFTSGAKLFESVLQERADEWISSIGEEVADAMRALSELRGGDE